MPNRVELISALNYGKVRAGQANQVYLMLKLNGKNVEQEKRVPLNI